ncbi:OLC1v1037710C1 [Oldenlandia corymbosa var. corymbosa]|uniref:OLC1v1037710C1 n=1 Tax=Oldenlandia corymbosa var. corymbosa TaxID=529605 RepID=A0AAV1CZJ0_OLDCO|nr:OLC1v1037710C1 [Oldenlandia corymbosa var. corymbosa]
MPSKKPKIVIIGAGMAGITAANKLYKSAGFKDLFELCVVEGGTRIGGRINTSEFGGDRIEMGATWIHGIKGSPIHKIAQDIHSLESDHPWECMDSLDDPITIAEGGHELSPSIIDPISNLFKKLMDFAQGKSVEEDDDSVPDTEFSKVNFAKLAAAKSSGPGKGNLGIGSYLRKGLESYWNSVHQQEQEDEGKLFGNWTKRALQEAIFAMHENTQRTYTSAGDLDTLDYNAESEYIMFPGEEVTIAKGYLSVVDSLASVLPSGLIQLGRKVTKIEWQPADSTPSSSSSIHRVFENGHGTRPVIIHFLDGSTMSADHVIVTVSLGVLKQGIRQESGLFNPPLPNFKTEAITKLGFGVVNKLFLQLSPTTHDHESSKIPKKFPSLQLVFHQSGNPNSKSSKIPWWMRKTATLAPIYSNSSVLLSWFAGEEALQLESMNDDDILDGVSATVSNLLSKSGSQIKSNSNSHQLCNGDANSEEGLLPKCVKFDKILKSRWGTNPLFWGSYSYVAVGSSGDDLDAMAEPLPKFNNSVSSSSSSSPQLQILFAGEATHRTHYSTTHGAYFSGLREANRLLQHYNFISNGI